MESIVPKSTRWAQANPEKARESARNYYHRNKEKVKKRAAEWRKDNPDRSRAWRDKHRIEKYGLTGDQYESLLALQGSKCAICKDDFVVTPHIDHCHSTGKVRGLLCSTCNTALGKFKDDVEVLTSAITYLQTEVILWTP